MAKENEPATPKTRPRRACAPRKIIDPLPSPGPHKRPRTLRERNDSDFDMASSDSDIEMILSAPATPIPPKPKKANIPPTGPRIIEHTTFMQYWEEAIDKAVYNLRRQ
ncbi:hypothetical protein FRC12_013950 [Ceratobasidium sp. 428]|nr:hypothetical protein FRC12_013950 [Ceratobasidium sp. 428]